MATAAATLDRHRTAHGLKHGLVGRIVLSVLIVATLAPLAGAQLAEALDPSATGAGQAFERSAAITSHTVGDASASAMVPGTTTIERTTVRVGEARAQIGLYGTIDGSGLERYLDLRILARGNDGPTLVFEGTLSDLPRTEEGALDLGTWDAGEERTYRIVTTLRDTNAAQGLTTSADLVFTAEPTAP